MNDPYMGVWEYTYDENGNLVSQIDGNFDETSMYYDPLNRIEEKIYIEDATQVSYTYDEERTDYYNIGSLTTVEFGDTVTEYNYDEMGRTVNESRIIDGANSGEAYLIDREYDLAGRIESITYPDSARTKYVYEYDPIGTLDYVKVDGSTDLLADYNGYNPLGQVGSVIYKNNSGTDYLYKTDGSYRLEYLTTTTTIDDNLIDLQDFYYTFDDVGNIEGIVDSVSGTTQTFEYDEIDRLDTATSTSSDPNREFNQTYTYDLAGNMIERTGFGAFNVAKWEDSIKHIRPIYINYKTQIDGLADRSVTYDQNDKPDHITYDGTTHTYLSYDGEGNRVRKVQGGDSVVYVGNLYEERYDGEDAEYLSYIYANGKKFVTITDSHEYYSHSDHLGSTTLTTDETGQVLEEIGYLPFGAELFRNIYNGEEWESSYKFTGQEFDKEYQFYNYVARLYDPVMGRFITPDSEVAEPYNPQSLNRYSYCLNNPLIYNDPTGHTAQEYDVYVDGIYTGTISSNQSINQGLYYNTDHYNLPWGDISEGIKDLKTINDLPISFLKLLYYKIKYAKEFGDASATFDPNDDDQNNDSKKESSLPDDIARTFENGKYHTKVLQQDVTAYRYSGGVSSPTGRFLTTRQTIEQIGSPADAQRLLNLPNGATAEQLNVYTIPRGTTIYYGRVAGGGAEATQIYIEDPSVLRMMTP